jgi:hypothetical protein
MFSRHHTLHRVEKSARRFMRDASCATLHVESVGQFILQNPNPRLIFVLVCTQGAIKIISCIMGDTVNPPNPVMNELNLEFNKIPEVTWPFLLGPSLVHVSLCCFVTDARALCLACAVGGGQSKQLHCHGRRSVI